MRLPHSICLKLCMAYPSATPALAASLPASSASAVLSVPASLIAPPPAAPLKLEAMVAVTPQPPPETPWYNNSIAVGLLTLSGVIAGLVVNYLKMKTELRASADEAHRERITAIRNEVYTQLIADFVQASQLLGGLPTIDAKETPNYADPLLPLTASVNRTWLVSEAETARRVREVHTRVQELFMRCVTRVPAMQEHKDTIKSCSDTIRRAEANTDELFRELRRNLVLNGGNSDIHTRLMALKDFEADVARRARASREEAAAAHHVLVVDYMKALVPELEGIMQGVQEFMYSARLEMGIQGDSELLRQQTTDMFGRVRASIDKVVVAVQKDAFAQAPAAGSALSRS